MRFRLISFLKKEAVLIISAALALLSICFLPPDRAYLGYIDLRTLALLLILMLIVAGFQAQGVFARLGGALLRRVHGSRSLVLVLVLLPFFTSMLITNDVALLTFVPFAIAVLRLSGMERRSLQVVILQTLAANLGSMLTPIGNPQNLYLYARAGLSPLGLIRLMLPYSALALLLLCAASLRTPKHAVAVPAQAERAPVSAVRIAVYCALFALTLLTVLRILPYWIVLLVTLAAVLALDRRLLAKADYSLLLTFVALFIFIGNLGRIAPVRDFLTRIVAGRETVVGLLASQVFSNVPAAILLSGFSSDLPALIIGVNLGGLGTLIASMASLISFRLYTRDGGHGGRFLGQFTLWNLAFLALELALWLLLR